MNLAQVYVADIFPGALNVPWTELVREGELKRPMNWMRYLLRRQLRQTNYRQLRLWCNGSRGFVSTRDAGCAKRETVTTAHGVNGARGQIYRLSQ